MKTQIAKIISDREKISAEVNAHLAQWQERLAQAKKMRSDISDIRKTCMKALAVSQGEDVAVFRDLLNFLDKIEREQTVRSLQADCSYALERLERLNQRFNRKTINIAIAGMGRCGKSSALKSIIGQKQDENLIIPSGNGPAVTASKSTICCVLTPEEEKTVVYYRTVDSFLNDLVNPILQSIELSDFQCKTCEDFENLDYELLSSALELVVNRAKKATKNAELEVHKSDDKTAAENALTQAQDYEESVGEYAERLTHLHDIIKAFPSFKTRLTGAVDTVELNQTYRYVSYPKDDSPAICYAVKECKIYTRFPNKDVQSLELVDLPGLGTDNLNEEKCFLEGFNYTVDLALILRRPGLLFQNFPTKLDNKVIKVLRATFGDEHLHESSLIFQNDANLPQDDVEAAFQKIVLWNNKRDNPVTVFRGDAFDADFMQNKLLPDVLNFILRNLPKLDKTLLDEVIPSISESAKNFDEQRNALLKKLAVFKLSFPSTRGANAINDKVTKIRDFLMNGLTNLMELYGGEFETQNSSLSEAIEKQTEALKSWAQEHYNPQNETQVEEVKNRIRANMSAVPYANREIHSIRIKISEIYSELEKIHETLISEMQDSVAKLLQKCFPALLSENDSLNRFISLAEESNECLEIIDAVRTLTTLEVPFYNVIYPDLRKEVFESMSELEKNFILSSDTPADKQAKIALGELQNIALGWIWKAENLLHSQSKITEIITASLERFQDRMIRNEQIRRELVCFVEHFWSDIQNEDNAFGEDVRNKLEKM